MNLRDAFVKISGELGAKEAFERVGLSETTALKMFTMDPNGYGKNRLDTSYNGDFNNARDLRDAQYGFLSTSVPRGLAFHDFSLRYKIEVDELCIYYQACKVGGRKEITIDELANRFIEECLNTFNGSDLSHEQQYIRAVNYLKRLSE
ncbi:MAG: hypothetical protein AABW46_01120 [Nanoarchaeota archaeon]